MTDGLDDRTPQATDRRYAEAIALANIPTLLMVLVQLTGELRWLSDPYRPCAPRGLDDNDSGGLPEEVQNEIRSAALNAILGWRAGRPVAISDPDPALFVAMLSIAMAEPIPAEYGPMMAGDLAAVLNKAQSATEEKQPARERTAIIIGAGVSGLCAAVRLQQLGTTVTILERNHDIGGTWLENRYPGAGVDTPSHLYEYSFAPHDWPHFFASRDEVHEYLTLVADAFHIRQRILFDTAVRSASFDEATNRWTVEVITPRGVRTHVADIVISAVGAFNTPKMPMIQGIDRFEGQWCHTARWLDLDVRNKRVAVIGNGASAMQTVPAIVDDVESLVIFQRSPHWVAPFDKLHHSVPEPLRFLLREVPLYHAWYRQRLNWAFNDKLHASLHRDPNWSDPGRSLNATNDRHREYFTAYLKSELAGRDDLIESLLPSYPPYGKRMLLDNGWYRSLMQDQVRLVTSEICEIREHSIVTNDGAEHDVDVIVYATGFDVVRFLSTVSIHGRNDRTLASVWDDDDARAFLGLAVPGFPNFFILYGPNTQPGHGGSLIAAVESQVEFIVRALAKADEWKLPTVEITSGAYEEYCRRVDAKHEAMVWTHPGMDTYYRNSRGRVVVGNPFRIVDFWHSARQLEREQLVGTPAS